MASLIDPILIPLDHRKMVNAHALCIDMISSEKPKGGQSRLPLASNPGPHHHRICDRREEGLVKPPFCFASFPTIVGNISHSNYLAKSGVFKSVFDSQKRRGARPAQAELVKVQTQGKSQLGARRRLNMVKKGAEERTKTFWFGNRWLFGPEIYSPL